MNWTLYEWIFRVASSSCLYYLYHFNLNVNIGINKILFNIRPFIRNRVGVFCLPSNRSNSFPCLSFVRQQVLRTCQRQKAVCTVCRDLVLLDSEQSIVHGRESSYSFCYFDHGTWHHRDHCWIQERNFPRSYKHRISMFQFPAER